MEGKEGGGERRGGRAKAREWGGLANRTVHLQRFRVLLMDTRLLRCSITLYAGSLVSMSAVQVACLIMSAVQ